MHAWTRKDVPLCMAILAFRQLHDMPSWSMNISTDITLPDALWQSLLYRLDGSLLPQLGRPGYGVTELT